MQTKFIAIGLAFLFLTPSISSEINIDGILDEEEWKSARIFKNFYEVYPYSLKEVKDIETEILILESNKGIYFGFKNFQPSETMRIKNHLRDEERSISDKTGISIDFDGPIRCKQIKVLAVLNSTPSETNKSTISFELAYMSELSVEPTVPFPTAMTPIRLSEYMN